MKRLTGIVGTSCVVLSLFVLGCGDADRDRATLTLATTTSTRDSGLLNALVPLFEAQSGIEVKVVAVGSGQALEMGRRGDADVLLTHAPEAEKAFVAAGHGIARRRVMHNDFVLVGPAADPADVHGIRSVGEAVTRIARSASPFVSRGDESGTHMKERAIWRQAGIEPQGEWYVRAGAGMAQALRMADEMRAYTLSDRSTFLAQRDWLELVILSEGDPSLVNPYALIRVSPEKHPHVNAKAARRFTEFLLSPEGQQAIAEFGIEQYGQRLFVPDAGKKSKRRPPDER